MPDTRWSCCAATCPINAKDPEVVDCAQSLEAVLVTLNGDFADIINYPPGHFGGIIALQVRNHPGFGSATFEAKVDFKSVTFRKKANFNRARFEAYADFWHCTFMGDAEFRDTVVSAEFLLRRL